jgi:hypothetical protein
MQTLWVYRLPEPIPCNHQHRPGAQEKRDQFARTLVDYSATWIEVTHHHNPNSYERESFWMYRAAGSGLWYRQGKVRVLLGYTAKHLQHTSSRKAELVAGFNTLARSHCKDWHPVPRVELITYFGDPSKVPNPLPWFTPAFVNTTCRDHFAAGWSPRECARCGYLDGTGAVQSPGAGGHLLSRSRRGRKRELARQLRSHLTCTRAD